MTHEKQVWMESHSGERISDLGTPESFARAVAYISSPAAAYITGASLPVDGGWHRHAF
ncbi:SDR family oxidoreductase [Haladaptatus sp. T7]|uniref:SDR family oxidoreductase n=1 Tax=Haladaptatus sp. T7 TaxID=2029368 RepID=UPI00222EC36D|nr:SDR family oxidoreductase [Haladaptatus sp. T7]